MARPDMNRRVLAVMAALGVAATLVACSREAPSRYTQKLVILGFDGMDPDLLKQWIDAGRLPTFQRLAATGGL